MLQTKYPVKLEIDSKSYDVEFTPLNSTQVEELNKIYKSSTARFSELDPFKKDLKVKREIYGLNNESLRTIADSFEEATAKQQKNLLAEKRELLLEQKNLLKEIDEISTKIKVKSKELEEKELDVDKDVDSFEEKQFDMCVSGPDAVKVKALIKKSSLTYTQVLNEISKLAFKESEKSKQNSSSHKEQV